MRIAFPRLLRTRRYPNTGFALQECTRHHCLPWLDLLRKQNTTQCRCISGQALAVNELYDDTYATPHLQSHDGDEEQVQHRSGHSGARRAGRGSSASRHTGLIPTMSPEQRQDPDTWIDLLEKYLPSELRQAHKKNKDSGSKHPGLISSDLLTILQAARQTSNTGIDVLAHMILGSRRKAALWLCGTLLKNLASRMPSRPSDLLPSNIVWPADSFHNMTRRSFTVDTVSHTSFERCEDWDGQIHDPRYSSIMFDTKDRTMDQIWTTLGSVVVQSANMSDEEAQKAMNAVLLVLGQVHNLDLVPDNVYAYQTSSFPVTVQRPPLVHLVSSRILTALSDAAWRSQQEENIEKAASHGLSYEQIGRDPPGGRFRLKVRPMEAEIWLEFILWCCVEGGFLGAGSSVVKLLQTDTQDPWFAVNWSRHSSGHLTPQVDWERVKTRTGGTVGRIEGYSKSKPLAEVPSRTISAEVVLALVDAHIDAVQRVRGSKGMASGAAQNAIVNLISFLEPHDLPLPYFDYLSTRLLMTDAFDVRSRSNTLKRWSDRLGQLKSLKPAYQPLPPQISFDFDALLVHSEFTAGLMHQLLDSFVQDGNIHDALKTFNNLQKLVDNSKLHAIAAFLRGTYSPDEKFFSSRFFAGNPDFVNSHGQLPYYKLAGLLNLATDTNLVGFGQWLLFNADIDGALVPRRAYTKTAMARALIRFAGTSNDLRLLRAVVKALQSKVNPSVNVLRAIFNARISLLHFEQAALVLNQLRQSQGGGYGLSNLANLAGIILKLERNIFEMDESDRRSVLSQAVDLFDSMLAGHFDGRAGVLQSSVRTTFRQQVAHLLTIFEYFPESRIAAYAGAHRDRFRSSNIPNLSPSIFNTFLEAVTAAKGALTATVLVDKFCTMYGDNDTVRDGLSGNFIEDEEPGLGMDSDETSSQVSTLDGVSQAALEVPEDVPMQAFIPFASSLNMDQQNTAQNTGSFSKPFESEIASTHSFIPFASQSNTDDASNLDESAETPVIITDSSSQGQNKVSLHQPSVTATSGQIADQQNNDEDASIENLASSTESGEIRSRFSYELPLHQTDQDSDVFSSPFFPNNDQQAIPTDHSQSDAGDTTDNIHEPVCVHDTRTIRLIVRKALQEKHEREETGLGVAKQYDILAWARRNFHELGCTPYTIANEIREPVVYDELSIPNSVPKVSRRLTAQWGPSASSRVSKTFSGKPIMRVDLGLGQDERQECEDDDEGRGKNKDEQK